jgi:TctA family transporter
VSGLFVFSGVGLLTVDFSESISDSLPELFSGFTGLEVVLSDVLDVREVVDDKASRHDMALVDVLHETLDSGFLDEFLFVEGTLGSDEVASDTGDQKMREFVSLNERGVTLLPVS